MVIKVDYMRTVIKIDLGNLKDYLLQLSMSLSKSNQAFINKIEAKAAEMPDELRDDWLEWNSDIHWQLTDVFPNILNNSLLVTIYSYLESTLFDISRHKESQNPKLIKINDLRGDGIELYRNYLKKVHAIKFPDTSDEWKRITVYRKIRNFIIHNDRILDNSKNAENIRQFAEQFPKLISINQFDQISVSEQSNIDFIDVVQNFLMDLLEKSK